MPHPAFEPASAPEAKHGSSTYLEPPWVWPWALAAFVLAAGTGAAMRFGMIYGWPAGVGFGDVRHAHSHLMYFGWVTPMLFALIATALARCGVTVRGVRPLLVGTFVAAFASYPAFLTSGYRSAPWLGVELPWSMMAAGLNGMAWLAFLGLYALAALRPKARTDERARAVVAWTDAAVFLLAASIVGIVALAGTATSGPADPRITAALVDLFLAWFGEGWFTAGVLGLATGSLWVGSTRRAGSAGLRLAALVFAIGIVTRGLSTFLLELAPAGERVMTVSGIGAVWGASTGHLLVGSALVGATLTLLSLRPWRDAATALWIPALGFLLLKGLFEIGFAAPGFRDLVTHASVRVFLLHAFLLGGISMALVAAAAQKGRGSRWIAWGFAASVIVLLAGLVPLSGIFPVGLGGVWSLQLAAWTSLAPVATAILLLWRAIAGTRNGNTP